MRLIHSYWFGPFREEKSNRYLGGFLSEQSFWYCWALSVYVALEHYDEIVLYADSEGKAKAIDTLKLPYTEVRVAFDDLTHINPDLWAYGKLLAYSEQTEPFAHIDLDVFLWEPLLQRLESAPVFAQTIERTTGHRSFYLPLINLMKQHLEWLPESFIQTKWEEEEEIALNCGVVGGSNLELIRAYAKESMQIVHTPENQRGWKRMSKIGYPPTGLFNCVFEQANLLRWCKLSGVKPETLIEDTHDLNREELRGLRGYTHLVADAKLDPQIAGHLGKRLESYAPEVKRRIDRMVGTD